MFNGGQINGLFYETPSFSGLIDAGGVFRYRDGESVRFALGGIELGSARGEPTLDLFDLVGAQPVVDEAVLRADLGNRARVTDLDRVGNRIRLLATLDRDRDLDNGINLDGWHAELADYQVSFESDLYLFPQQRNLTALTTLRTAFDIDYEPSLAAPLVFLYDSLGLKVKAQLPVKESVDSGEDGSVEHETETKYNDFGLPETVQRMQIPGNGQTWRQVVSYRYDDEARVLQQQSEHDTDSDGLADSRFSYHYRYDSSGLLLEQSHETGDPEVNARSVSLYQYDSGGNQIRLEYERKDAEGTLLRRDLTVSRFTGNGLVRDIERKNNTDGNTDLELHQRIEYQYSSAGLRSSSLHTIDGGSTGADGVIDTRTESAYMYDSSDRLILEVQRADGQADGIVDSELTTRRRYDNRGFLVEEIKESDRYADGSIESRHTMLYRYDNSGNLTGLESRFDRDLDGNPETTYTTEYSYNSRGQLVLQENSSHHSDGTSGTDYSERRTYGVHGEMLTRRTESHGSTYTVNTPVITRWDYQPTDDGLRHLIDHYKYSGSPVALVASSCMAVSFGGGVIACAD
ncbi:hypothetical protein [Microbulbifer sp. ALW1]|uniref:hypothetical protein n=1 Tax=Microbulbifer sp. (strain ALW1) TaxID=1516059 RepID=UPI0013581ED5|nr:hypothetical protein [Microbulbifer sp. ALW1]